MFVELGWGGEPLAGMTGADVLGGEGEVAGDADAGVGQQVGGEEVEEFVVALGCFDEDLGLVVAVDALFEGADE